MTNTLRDSRAGRAGERGSLPAAQFPPVCDQCGHRLQLHGLDYCTKPGCECGDSESMSVCCGAPEHPDVEGFCSSCNEGTSFETAKQIEADARAAEMDTQDDLGCMFARVHGGFGDALQGHAHNVEDAIADVRELGGER